MESEDMAREAGIDCFNGFVMDVLKERERNETKQYLGIFTARVTEESIYWETWID